MQAHPWILRSDTTLDILAKEAGGKATNLARMVHQGFKVPPFFAISSAAFQQFKLDNGLIELLSKPESSEAFEHKVQNLCLSGKLPLGFEEQLAKALRDHHFDLGFTAVRSSGLDEDGAQHSFAGQFSSYLFQSGLAAIVHSLRLCWASAYSARAIRYRLEHGLDCADIGVGVVIQKMIAADRAGVAFSRHPIKVLQRDRLLISSVYGAGEGLVSGLFDADSFDVGRSTGDVHSDIVPKPRQLVQAPQGGLIETDVPQEKQKAASLTAAEIAEISRLAVTLEEKLGCPQDCEWAIEAGSIFLVQTRPITNLPPDAYYDATINGRQPTLWDNSNIIESYSGVTSPLTFSFASRGYNLVYIQFARMMGAPEAVIEAKASAFRNMLGLIRGRVYYNLAHWYELVQALPGAKRNRELMDTMMGVKAAVNADLEAIFANISAPTHYSVGDKLILTFKTLQRWWTIDSIVEGFFAHFNAVYNEARKKNFRSMNLLELKHYFDYLDLKITNNWQPPLINDFLCMIFFGILKKLTSQWVASEAEADSLQNDLLCGEGGLDSTEPTKFLMRLAASIDKGDARFRQWFLDTKAEEVIEELRTDYKHHPVGKQFEEFLDRFGFRCVNELKLEEPDLHEDPSFVIHSLQSYIRTKSYQLENMEHREREIRHQAEEKVRSKLGGLRLIIFFFILRHARKAVKHRENLRFARTKIYGVCRHLFRAMGGHLTAMRVLEHEKDIFYLTLEELFGFMEGRLPACQLGGLVKLRREEFDHYRETPAPPDRFLTYGAAGFSNLYPAVMFEADLLQGIHDDGGDPNRLKGTPCCPGTIEGVVRVVHQLKDAEGINGEILVTARTDPGWVPLFPSCSGLLIERGSLLSHSAVVARELGLPTIVGINGGLLQKLKTGDRVRMDASKGEIYILKDEV